MASYIVHAPPAGAGDARAFDAAVLVKDGFSVFAFALTLIWALWHRMWLVALLVLLFDLALIAALGLLGVHPLAAMGAELAVSLLIGLEAAAIRSWHLARKGRPAAFVVVADDAQGAEDKAALLWSRGTGAASNAWRPAPAPRPAPAAVPATGGPVLGLFPDPERRP